MKSSTVSVSPPPTLPFPEEVWRSRWEVMGLCGSVGGDMTGCQALMQPNIWSLLAASLLACRRGPFSPGPGATLRDRTRGKTWASETGSSSHNAARTERNTQPAASESRKIRLVVGGIFT
ncbi:hypothetical protein PBY51_022100 [Eleginops maclovinus]|uniref:Uncharacterized protein n=1 Tax=Eleginops maclovinus TaxID=56733 RepID=A0AAN8AI11_ELEMC|nr:hypothetical protein PBY51_022100 [Eleginops maclovinus]